MKTLNELTSSQLDERSRLEKNQKIEMQGLLDKLDKERISNEQVDLGKQLQDLKKAIATQKYDRDRMFARHEKEYELWHKVKTVIRMGKENSVEDVEKLRLEKIIRDGEHKALADQVLWEFEQKNSGVETTKNNIEKTQESDNKELNANLVEEVNPSENKKSNDITEEKELSEDELLDKRVAERLRQYGENKKDYTRE